MNRFGVTKGFVPIFRTADGFPVDFLPSLPGL